MILLAWLGCHICKPLVPEALIGGDVIVDEDSEDYEAFVDWLGADGDALVDLDLDVQMAVVSYEQDGLPVSYIIELGPVRTPPY